MHGKLSASNVIRPNFVKVPLSCIPLSAAPCCTFVGLLKNFVGGVQTGRVAASDLQGRPGVERSSGRI